MPERATVFLEGIAKAYGPQPVLRRIDLRVAPGEVVAVVGASGTGKSTLLNILGLLDNFDSGTYHLLGEDVGSLSRARRCRLRAARLGFVFQGFHLLPEFTVLENILLAARCAGRSPIAARGRALDLLAAVGIRDKAGRDIRTLSGGEAQRVALCRALLLKPPLVLADEPTGNLDPATATVVAGLLLELAANSGASVIIVTHDAEQAARANRSLVLHDGIIETADSPA